MQDCRCHLTPSPTSVHAGVTYCVLCGPLVVCLIASVLCCGRHRECETWQCNHASAFHQDRIVCAAGRLFSQTVPEFAQQLNDGTLRFADNAQLVQLLHAAGINFRFMGYVRNRVTFQWARECLLSEMICRVLRGLFRAELRRIRHTGDHRMVADVVLSFFNHALGSSVDSDMFWVKVKQRLSDKYVGVEALSEAERESGYDLRLSVSVGVFVEG
jgi:hypothetical protein